MAVAVSLAAAALDAPSAPLRPDRTGGRTMPATLIELDGSISENPEGGTLEYRWTQTDGPPVELSDPTSPKPNFRTAEPGVYVFELVVSSDGLQSEPHIVQLEIECENLPPVAKIPSEATGQVGKLFELDDGESFDPEGVSLTYRWRPITGGLELPLSALSKQVLSFEPTREGVYDIELVVSDGEKTSPPAICRLAIRPRPKPPVARARVIALGPGGDNAGQPVILSSDTVPANSLQASVPPSSPVPP
ncbi:MAG: hypothetical protein LUG50_15105, partial [Planctomycetaceae bacterium]|nr:hypothetical protein [Planctomycetaceae bacterium]